MIETLDVLAADALARLFRVAWQAAALIAVVALCERFAGRRLGPRWRYALWLLVAVRLVVPELPRVPFGLLPLEPGSSSTSIEAEPLAPAPPPSLVASEPLATTATAVLPTSAAVAPRTEAERAAGPSPSRNRPRAGHGSLPPPAPAPRVPWALLGASLWLSVAAALFLRHVIAARAFARRLERDGRDADPPLRLLVEECRRALRVRRAVRTVVTGLVSTPAVTGAFRTRLLLPPRTLARFEHERLRPMILHELAHVRSGDLALNWLLAAVHCLHWYHPLVRFALHRVRDCQESLRDFEALAADPRTEPIRYAASLVDLLDEDVLPRAPLAATGIVRGRNDVKRRILMIASFDRTLPKRMIRGSAALGLPILAFLSVVALTSAVAPAVPREGGQAAPRSSQSIVVVRQDPVPEFVGELRAKLATKMDVNLADSSFVAFADALRQATGVNVVVDRDASQAFEDGQFTLRLDGVPAETALRIGCERLDLDYGFALGAVLVGWRGSIAEAYDTRYYNVQPLLQGRSDEITEHLESLVRECLRRPEAWDSPHASVDVWNGLVCVRQSESAHAEIERFLTRLANGGRAPDEAPPAWRIALEKALARPMDVSFDEADMEAVAKRLAEASGVPVRVARDHTDAPITLSLENVSLGSVLGWIERLSGMVAEAGEHGIGFTSSPRVDLFYFDVADLLRGTDEDEREERLSRLEDLLRRGLGQDAFEREGTGFLYWDDLLIVALPPSLGVRVDAVLSSLRRALG